MPGRSTAPLGTGPPRRPRTRTARQLNWGVRKHVAAHQAQLASSTYDATVQTHGPWFSHLVRTVGATQGRTIAEMIFATCATPAMHRIHPATDSVTLGGNPTPGALIKCHRNRRTQVCARGVLQLRRWAVI